MASSIYLIYLKQLINFHTHTNMLKKTQLDTAMLTKGLKRMFRRVPIIKDLMSIIKKGVVGQNS